MSLEYNIISYTPGKQLKMEFRFYNHCKWPVSIDRRITAHNVVKGELPFIIRLKSSLGGLPIYPGNRGSEGYSDDTASLNYTSIKPGDYYSITSDLYEDFNINHFAKDIKGEMIIGVMFHINFRIGDNIFKWKASKDILDINPTDNTIEKIE